MTPRLFISLLLYSHVDCLYYSGTTRQAPSAAKQENSQNTDQFKTKSNTSNTTSAVK